MVKILRPLFLTCVAFAFLALPTMALAAVSGTELIQEKPIEVKPGKMGTVVVFLSAKCPCSNSHIGILKRLANDFKDTSFVAIHSNINEERGPSKEYFKKAALPFPVIEDVQNNIADQYRALKTPHAFFLSPDGKILYQGGVTSSNHGETADQQYLRNALSDFTAGRVVKVAEGRALGCVISRGKKNVWK